MSARQSFLETYLREHAVTATVLRAYPAEQSEMKPHERSNSARVLAWTFVVEEQMMLRALTLGSILGSPFPPVADTWAEVLRTFDAQHEEVVRVLRTASDDAFARTIQFFTGPKQLGDYAMMDFLWFMVHDQIHHRGQLSVYLRMAGGKVPSIYGPSADEPWR